MTKFDLFDSIGNVDEELIEKATKPKKSGKKIFLAVTSMAACAVFACTAVLIVQNRNKSNHVLVDSSASSVIRTSSVQPVNEESSENGAAGGVESKANSDKPVNEESSENKLTGEISSEASVPENSDEIAHVEIPDMPLEIYYVANGSMKQKTIVTAASPENLFAVWKAENHIGQDVKFISVDIADNSKTEISEIHGSEVAIHTMGDYFIYTLTISKDIEKYYDTLGKELLLASLEKTMTEAYDPIPDEYHLILSEHTEDETTESQSSVSDDNQNNNDVVDSVDYSEPKTGLTNPVTEESEEYITQGYLPDEFKTEQPSSNYAEESESNHIAKNDIWYNDQGEAFILE